MEKKKIKLLFSGRKGILLQSVPKSIDALFKIIESYYHVDSAKIQLTFKDSEKDECEILDDITYFAACNEFASKIVLTISLFNSTPISRLNAVKVIEGRASLKYFKKKSRKMAVFDLENESTQWVTFPNGINFKEYAAWTEIPSGEIFYCGGGHPMSSNEVYLLNPYTQSFKVLPSMQEPRHSHGIVYSNGFVYIFGGIKNMMFLGSNIKHCERFSLELEKWEQIFDLEKPIADVFAVNINDNIFLIGKGSQTLIQYNSNCVNIDLGESEGGCMSVLNSLVYVFQGSTLKICDVNNQKIVEEQELPRKESWWSHCPPVVFNNFIYFVWWEEPGWICRYCIQSKEFKKITSLFT